VRTTLFTASLVSLSLLVSACGKGGGTPTAPAATTQTINVTGPDRVFIGGTETFTATAVMSDGTTRVVTTGWASDAPGVATVEATSGRVTGAGSGMATIFIVHEGRQGQKVVRSLPNFQGTWSGSYVVRGCTQSGQVAAANLCGDVFTVNRVLPTNLNVTQDGDRVQGRFFLGTLGGDASGPVQTDGRLQLTGAIHDGGTTIETVWALESQTPGRITGGFTMQWRLSGFSGDVRVNVDIRDLNRSSNLTPGAAAVETGGARTLEELMRMVVTR
jgi:hypothetical protein